MNPSIPTPRKSSLRAAQHASLQAGRYGGEGGKSGRGLVIGLATLLVVVAAIKTWQYVNADVVWSPPARAQRALPPEPLLEGLDALHGAALQARIDALVAAVGCADTGACTGVDNPGRVRLRPSLVYREAVVTLRKRQATEARP